MENCEKDLVSIIVPVYQVEKYIERCIESLRMQSYDNLEIIVVDDGSKDACPQMCDRWAMEDSRIKVIHQENQGISAARNKGLSICSGSYVMLVDSDDFVEREYVELLYKAITSQSADMSVGALRYVNESGQESEKMKAYRMTQTICMSGLDAMLGLENQHSKLLYEIVWNKMFRRELFCEVAFPVGKISEDVYVLPKLYAKCEKIVYIPDILYNYVMREGSITNSKREFLIRCQIECMEAREEMYKQIACKELFLMQQIHLYEMYRENGMLDKHRKERIRCNIKKAYREFQYQTQVSVIRKAKFFLARVNLDLYCFLVRLVVSAGKK
ncbi:MAG: glycosyltransferase family 2 protein [Firmicutes bacterium]|nr:glycosyltransferase family 2 protein [Bacillota bacterium]